MYREKLKKLKALLCSLRPNYFWLYRNRFLRMDANVAINPQERRQFHLDRYEFAVKTLGEKNFSALTLLDAACGTGYGSDMLKRLNPQSITGVDLSAQAVNYANKKYGSANCKFIEGDVTKLNQLRDHTFDAVVSFETIEHLDDPLSFLQNIKRLLRSDGVLIISTPNSWGPTRDHKFDYNYALLREHLEKFFKIESVFVQNSGSQDLWINRGAPRRLVEATPANIAEAECFIAVCRSSSR